MNVLLCMSMEVIDFLLLLEMSLASMFGSMLLYVVISVCGFFSSYHSLCVCVCIESSLLLLQVSK